MKSKRIYYRRKGKSIVIEGKEKGKSILIWTLPNPTLLLNHLGVGKLMKKASIISIEKTMKIHEKLERLDFRTVRGGNKPK